MKTTLNLPDNLVVEAMKATGSNKTQTIVKALEGLTRKDRLSRLMDQGKVDPDTDDETPGSSGDRPA